MTLIDTPIGQLAVERPAASRVFQRHGLDYCCGGDRPLAEACRAKGLDPTRVLAEIANAAPDDGQRRWDRATTGELIAHIENRYHAWLHRELGPLLLLSRKVATVHGEAHPHLLELHRIVDRLVAETIDHLAKEENVLFPWLRNGTHMPMQGPIACLRGEHDAHGANLARMRELAGDYRAPVGACRSWQALYLRLEELERELMEHIHLENHVLFPRAIAPAGRTADDRACAPAGFTGTGIRG